ncbi:ribose 5-phosphate isomerase B [Vaginisenegalia massiliensis]|uniref:ribose 5-phosphate isomerase B n=1 Tax=Vaginisenegalia massiliensis TaxID=2058294 RepID=UPI000F54545E|nr:ribose 5-phosphate isomerase B [Vaginisenegalia massiliensis]
MKIVIGSDHNAYELKKMLKEYIEVLGHEVIDVGCNSTDEIDYPNVAFSACEYINNGRADRGILCCGTGIGMAMAANKIPGIRAAQCHDTYSAERAQLSNNAQIITLGSKVVGPEVAKHIIKTYLSLNFEGGNSGRKIAQIMAKEAEHLK